MKKTMSTDPSDQVNLKIAYLNILQNIIARMSNYVLAIQTASVTVMTALLAFSATDKVSFHWWLFLVPWFVFVGYHVYFLRLERAFRQLYNSATITTDIEVSDFKIDKQKLDSSAPCILKVLFSIPLLVFHIALLIVILSAYIFLTDKTCTFDNYFIGSFLS